MRSTVATIRLLAVDIRPNRFARPSSLRRTRRRGADAGSGQRRLFAEAEGYAQDIGRIRLKNDGLAGLGEFQARLRGGGGQDRQRQGSECGGKPFHGGSGTVDSHMKVYTERPTLAVNRFTCMEPQSRRNAEGSLQSWHRTPRRMEGRMSDGDWWTWSGSNRRPLPCHNACDMENQ